MIINYKMQNNWPRTGIHRWNPFVFEIYKYLNANWLCTNHANLYNTLYCYIKGTYTRYLIEFA